MARKPFWQLSEGRDMRGLIRRHTIMKDRSAVGYADVTRHDKMLRVHLVELHPEAVRPNARGNWRGTVGFTGIQQLMRDARRHYPGIESIRGSRVTGARRQAGIMEISASGEGRVQVKTHLRQGKIVRSYRRKR